MVGIDDDHDDDDDHRNSGDKDSAQAFGSQHNLATSSFQVNRARALRCFR